MKNFDDARDVRSAETDDGTRVHYALSPLFFFSVQRSALSLSLAFLLLLLLLRRRRRASRDECERDTDKTARAKMYTTRGDER